RRRVAPREPRPLGRRPRPPEPPPPVGRPGGRGGPMGRPRERPGASVSEANALHELLRALRATRDGDLSVRLPGGQAGVAGEIASGRFFETAYRLRRAAGAYRWHLARSLPARGPNGELTGWVGTCTDIDDRKRAEDAQALLVDASAVLGSSLDYYSTLGQVAE